MRENRLIEKNLNNPINGANPKQLADEGFLDNTFNKEYGISSSAHPVNEEYITIQRTLEFEFGKQIPFDDYDLGKPFERLYPR